MKPWFEQFPHRLEEEIAALKATGVVVTVDEHLKNEGIIRLSFTIDKGNAAFQLPDNAGDIDLIIAYPDLYPYFRPNVYALALDLPRHQNPIEKNLCLLARPTENWQPETTVAALLQTQLREVLIKGNVTDAAEIKADEKEQAEPMSEYYALPDCPVLFNDSAVVNQLPQELDFKHIADITVGIPNGVLFPTRLFVLDTTCNGQKNVTFLPGTIQAGTSQKVKGAIYSLPERPPADPTKALKWLREKLAEKGQKLNLSGKAITLKNGTITNVVGFAFPEEVVKGEEGIGWLFLIEGSQKLYNAKGEILSKLPSRPGNYYAKAAKINDSQNLARAPRLQPLSDKKIGVVGLGALGSFAAIEFARSSVGALKIADYDVTEYPTSVRWPLGLAVAGRRKAEVLDDFIKENYPATGVEPFHWHIGGHRVNATGAKPVTSESEQTLADRFFEGLSLIVDATVEVGIHHFLSVEAKKRGIPYICMYATPGAYGGMVMRMVPDKNTGCWMCMRHMENDKFREGVRDMDLPSDRAGGLIQPPGCGDITFTGAGFDLQNISMAGVRLAVSTLCSGNDAGYPDVDWDIGVLRLFDDDGKPLMPTWKGFSLEKHPECPYCKHEENYNLASQYDR